MNSLLRRLAAFGSLPFLSMVTPLLLLPVLARVGGADGWSSIAIGQAVGGFGSVVIGFGWSITGPPLIVQAANDSAREDVYRNVFTARLTLATVTIPAVSLLAAWLAPPGFAIDTSLMAVSASLYGFSIAWYCIGRGDARSIAAYEVGPRIVSTALSLLAVIYTRELWPYPVFLVAATASGVTAFNVRHFTRPIRSGPLFGQETRRRMRRNWPAALTDGAAVIYVAAPVPISGATERPFDTAALASADKLYRYGLYAVTALGNALQSWVLERNTFRRHLAAILAHAILGLVGFLGLSIFGPAVSALVFGPKVAASRAASMAYGVAFLAVSSSTPFIQNVLIPRGRQHLVLIAVSFGAVAALSVMLLASRLSTFGGIAGGLAVGEVFVCCAVIAMSLRFLRGDGERGPRAIS